MQGGHHGYNSYPYRLAIIRASESRSCCRLDLEGEMLDDFIPYRMLMSIRNANKAAGGRCEVSVYVDASRCLITDSPGRDCVLIGHLSYMVSEQYDVESGNGEAFGVAMMRLDKSHPIHSCRKSIGEISWTDKVIYLDRGGR